MKTEQTPDLFDDEPKPNSPEDLGAGAFVPRAERRPKPWETSHKDHPAQREVNQLEPGEQAPDSWNVATTDLGILHMRKFLAWCEEKEIDTAGHTVGALYVGLNAHSLDSFRWLCSTISRQKLVKLPRIVSMSKAILARDPGLLYSDPDQ
jgi:hypothetical protein